MQFFSCETRGGEERLGERNFGQDREQEQLLASGGKRTATEEGFLLGSKKGKCREKVI